MPLGEEHSNQPVVTVDGSPVPPEALSALVSLYVDDSVHVPSMAVLRFSDPHHEVLGQIGADIGKTVTIAVQQSGQGGPVEIFDGDVTALEKEVDQTGVFTTVRALDVRHRLQSGATVEAFMQMTVGDVVSRVLEGAKLQRRVGTFPGKADHRARAGESDWDFLCRLARGVGAAIWVEKRTVRFDTPVTAATAPAGTDPGTDPRVIARGRNLVSLHATLTGSGQVPEVVARGWDYKQRAELSAGGRVGTDSAALTATPAKLAASVGGKKHVVPMAGLPTQEDTQAAATAVARTRAGGFAEIEGVARGNPRLRAATAVHLVDVGPQFSGKYVLTSVRHEFDPREGYLTGFTAADASDRSVYGVIAGGAAPEDGEHAPTPALVTNVKDPELLGRVKVKFPFAPEYESWWARPVLLGAGPERGASWLPEVGDEVLVTFGRSLDEPYVLGGLFNGKDKAGRGWPAHVHDDGKVKRRAFTSRTGMVVEFLEDGQQASLTVSTNDGAQHLTLTQSGQKGITLVSEGALQLTAERDVTVTARGNVSVGTDTGKVSLKGNSVAIEATTSLDLKGTAVKIQGQASSELSASGITTVRGSMVKIN